MAEQKVCAILVVQEHLIIGELETRGLRLLDVLLDPMADWLQVFGAHVVHRAAKARAVASAAEVLVRKSDLQLALLGAGKHESPERRRFAYVDKQQFSALAIVGGYEVQGRLHLQVKRESIRLLAELGSFIPLTEATVSYAAPREDKLDAEVAILNKTAVSALSVGEPVARPLSAGAAPISVGNRE
ncbi:MAG TPA: hypothetical protein VHC19_17125 [Pirellulales bacterium]|jgi:hypothetical protein|nr:hypothetical protein [Pirellulales bacterium]